LPAPSNQGKRFQKKRGCPPCLLINFLTREKKYPKLKTVGPFPKETAFIFFLIG